MELGGTAMRGTVPCTNCGCRGHTAGLRWGGFPGNRGGRWSTGESSQVSRHTPHPELPVAHMWLYVAFLELSQPSHHKAVVDSGTAGNFIDCTFALSLGIPSVPVDVPFPVHALVVRWGHG
jgi:hypothetical protein